MKYGYARVSTVGQELEVQLQTLRDKGCEVIFSEKFTGKTTDRPEFAKLEESLKKGDHVVITKLDRLARNVEEGLETVQRWLKMGVTVEIMNLGQILVPSKDGKIEGMTKAFITMALAFAELERTMIVERMAEGKAIAKQDPNFREGRPKTHKNKAIEHALGLLENHTYKQVSEMTGISKSTLIRAKNKRKAEGGGNK